MTAAQLKRKVKKTTTTTAAKYLPETSASNAQLVCDQWPIDRSTDRPTDRLTDRPIDRLLRQLYLNSEYGCQQKYNNDGGGGSGSSTVERI